MHDLTPQTNVADAITLTVLRLRDRIESPPMHFAATANTRKGTMSTSGETAAIVHLSTYESDPREHSGEARSIKLKDNIPNKYSAATKKTRGKER
jgi:hypothetical protein